MEKLMNKMDNMEMDKVAGGKHASGCCRMKPPIGKLPIGGGHKITMAANVDETQNASACVGK